MLPMSDRSINLGINRFCSSKAGDIAFQWLRILESAVMLAGAKVLNSDSSLGKRYAGPLHDDRLRMNSKDPKIAQEARDREAMRLGHAIEDWLTPEFLTQQYNDRYGGAVRCWNAVRPRGHVGAEFAGGILVERSGVRPPLFPIDFYAAGARPDIRVGSGDGTEAVFDFTTVGEAGHLLDKGGGIVRKDSRVAFASEIVTLAWDRRDDVMKQVLHDLDPKTNPHPNDVPPRG
jgi:hypothetical protein